MARSSVSREEFAALELQNKVLRAQIESLRVNHGEYPYHGCGDNSCIIIQPQGMGTNGGCRCGERELRRAVLWLHRKVQFQALSIQDLKKELAKAESKILQLEVGI